MVRIIKWIAIGIGGLGLALVVIAGLVLLGAATLYDLRKPVLTAGGERQDTALYVRMGDGAKIAVDVWLPPTLPAGQRVPVLINATPYWRGYDLGFLGKALVELHAIAPPDESDTPLLNRRGYAVLTVDTRGTGASFGSQKIAFDDREIDDFGDLIGWAARQPWSNGKVGAYGFSYRGMLATDMAALHNPALKAIAPSFDFTDLNLVTHPGGVLDSYFVAAWGAQTAALNRGVVPCPGAICHLIVAGPKRVDVDRDGLLVKQAINEHAANYDMNACARAAPDRDDKSCSSGRSLTDVSEVARKSAIESAGTPMYVEVGYFDQTSPSQALRRFQTFSNPQIMIIGPLAHGGFQSTDPFRPKAKHPDPTYSVQVERMADFFDGYLKGDAPASTGKSVTYFVLGAEVWRTSDAWPPAGVRQESWYLQPGHGLAPTPVKGGAGSDDYPVDFAASSGELARYRSPVDLSRTGYPDRAGQDRKLTVYDSAPLDRPVEITGDPVAHLALASSRPDGEVIVYLEDVAPGGTVTYLTEGLLRLAHRKPALQAVGGDPLHSYLSADAAPMVPGKAESIDIALSPISAVIAKGHSIRIAIVGGDAGNLERLPASGPEVFTIGRDARTPSFITLPIMPDSGEGRPSIAGRTSAP